MPHRHYLLHLILSAKSLSQWIQGFFNHFASTVHAIGGKLLLKYPSTTFVKAKS